MILDEFAEINPSITLHKNTEYDFVDMEVIVPSNRYVKSKRKRSFSGGGAKFKNGDVLFARITPCLENGKIAQYKSMDATGVAFGSTEFIVFRGKEGVSNTGFLFYLVSSSLVREPAIKSMSGASGRQRVNLTAVKNIIVQPPAIETQQKIASILSAYDDLIENNTRRIQILEEMARRIYEEWFVRFRFPGHENIKMVESEQGFIPEGWEVSNVENTFSILGGGTPSKNVTEYWESGTINWYSPTDLTRKNTAFIDESSAKITALGLAKSSARMFPAFSVMLTSRATIGVVSINTTEASTNQGFIICLPNNKFPLYILFHWLKCNTEVFISLSSGATFKEISKGTFKQIKLIVAPSNLFNNFERLVAPIMQQLLNLQRKNETLRKTRDLLLPKLISGEIDVSGFPEPKDLRKAQGKAHESK